MVGAAFESLQRLPRRVLVQLRVVGDLRMTQAGMGQGLGFT